MTRNEELLLWASIGVLGGVAVWQRKGIMDTITRGKRLTYTTLSPDGVVPVDPAELAAQAGEVLGRDLPQELYDLARMKRSEQGKNDDGRIRVHVALNDAAEHNWSTHFAITYSTNPAAKGRYGEQFTPADRAPGGVKSVRRYATTHDPYEGDIAIVERVLLERAQGLDPTSADGRMGGGAVKFVDRSSLGGVQEGSSGYDEIVARWAAEGLQPFNVPGYPDDLVVFRRA